MANAEEYRQEAASLREAVAPLLDGYPEVAALMLEIARLYEVLARTVENSILF